jgi:cytoskeletal protein RodZ
MHEIIEKKPRKRTPRQTLGEWLKTGRIQKGVSLREAAQATNLRETYLIALEENRIEALPGQFFIKAYSETYAKYLGLPIIDLEKMLKRVKPFEEDDEEEIVLKQPRQRDGFLPTKQLILGSLLTCLIVYLGILFWDQEAKQPTPKPNQTQLEAKTHEIASSEQVIDALTTLQPTITLVANADTTIELVSQNGHPVHTAQLAASETYFLPQEQILILKESALPHVSIFVDARKVEDTSSLGRAHSGVVLDPIKLMATISIE